MDLLKVRKQNLANGVRIAIEQSIGNGIRNKFTIRKFRDCRIIRSPTVGL